MEYEDNNVEGAVEDSYLTNGTNEGLVKPADKLPACNQLLIRYHPKYKAPDLKALISFLTGQGLVIKYDLTSQNLLVVQLSETGTRNLSELEKSIASFNGVVNVRKARDIHIYNHGSK